MLPEARPARGALSGPGRSEMNAYRAETFGKYWRFGTYRSCCLGATQRGAPVKRSGEEDAWLHDAGPVFNPGAPAALSLDALFGSWPPPAKPVGCPYPPRPPPPPRHLRFFSRTSARVYRTLEKVSSSQAICIRLRAASVAPLLFSCRWSTSYLPRFCHLI